MNGKDLEKALLWEAPHIGEKAPEQIPEAQNFCEGYKTFLNEGKTERECVKKAVSLLTNAGYKEFDPKASYKPGDKIYWVKPKESDHRFHHRHKGSERGIAHERRPYRFPAPGLKAEPII